jgi:putative SOS response-associated peptidase YedK
MCGRFTLTSPAETVAELFELDDVPVLTPRYNIAPTQPVAVVRSGQTAGGRELAELRWGLIPSWAKDPSIGSRMINARAEGVAEKPSFRSAFRRRRCLVIADGFYEWQKVGTRKQPHYIHLARRRPFAFAGLWEHWEDADGDAVDSCTIITTEPNELIAKLHNRMPVILHPRDYILWLDPGVQALDKVQALLQPYPAKDMFAYAIGTRVNNPSNDTPACIEPLD